MGEDIEIEMKAALDRIEKKLQQIRPGDVQQGCLIDDVKILEMIESKGKKIEVNIHFESSGYCHRDTCRFVNNMTSARFVTGYSFLDGTWARHSWIEYSFNNEIKIVEMTIIRREIYYGCELSPEDTKRFCKRVS